MTVDRDDYADGPPWEKVAFIVLVSLTPAAPVGAVLLSDRPSSATGGGQVHAPG
jgi:hypothetical protein